ncbi:uncharacterized protein LOC135690519 [Rhopilema esculentum]|uniref:uncharacterized protein LOC135690519 n=1 Tax=Rhopilema esculentum TaxID=499914 RepID=UPI0031D27217|eukprot:gene1506-15948_t
MAETEVLFYIIIVIVILIKLMFWCLYLCLKNRRIRRLRQRQNESDNVMSADPTCYEEVPAIPQPAFVFTGLTLPLPNTVLTESLPEYQADDPFKTDQPPPSYGDSCNLRDRLPQELQSFAEIPQAFADIDATDTQRLIADNE